MVGRKIIKQRLRNSDNIYRMSFEFCSLHQRNIIRTCSPSGTGSGLLFIWIASTHKKRSLPGGGGLEYYDSPVPASIPQRPPVLRDWHNRLVFEGASNGPSCRSQNLVSPSVRALPLGLPGSTFLPPSVPDWGHSDYRLCIGLCLCGFGKYCCQFSNFGYKIQKLAIG